MEHSVVYSNLYYLLTLKNVDVRHRITLIRNITRQQMSALEAITRRIYDGSFPLLARDVNYFRSKRAILRSLFSARVNVNRKVATLVRNHSLIYRILRITYIVSTIMQEIG